MALSKSPRKHASDTFVCVPESQTTCLFSMLHASVDLCLSARSTELCCWTIGNWGEGDSHGADPQLRAAASWGVIHLHCQLHY